MTRDGMAEPVSRDQILRRERRQGNKCFPSSADPEQDWQPYPVDPNSAISDDHTYTLFGNRKDEAVFCSNTMSGLWRRELRQRAAAYR